MGATRTHTHTHTHTHTQTTCRSTRGRSHCTVTDASAPMSMNFVLCVCACVRVAPISNDSYVYTSSHIFFLCLMCCTKAKTENSIIAISISLETTVQCGGGGVRVCVYVRALVCVFVCVCLCAFMCVLNIYTIC